MSPPHKQGPITSPPPKKPAACFRCARTTRRPLQPAPRPTSNHRALGGAGIHAGVSGVAAMIVDDEGAAEHAVAAVLSYFPANNLETPPRDRASEDPVERRCTAAAAGLSKD